MRETASTKLLILIAKREREERDSHHLVVIEGPLAILNKDMSQNKKGRRRYIGAYSAGQLCATPLFNVLSKRSQIAGSRPSSTKLLIPIATRADEKSLKQG